MTHKLHHIFFFVFCISILVGCKKDISTFNKPYVESFVSSHKGEEYLIILAYGGSASNSIHNPIITNEDGHVRVQFTNKKVKTFNLNELYTSFRSFSGAERQASAIIELSDEVKVISYFDDGKWVSVWKLE